MKREGKKVDEGNGGCLRETVVAWSVCCFKLGEGEREEEREMGRKREVDGEGEGVLIIL